MKLRNQILISIFLGDKVKNYILKAGHPSYYVLDFNL